MFTLLPVEQPTQELTEREVADIEAARIWNANESVALQDPIAEAIDDIAALATYWAQNRARGRTPDGIRQAILTIARETLAYADAQRRLLPAVNDGGSLSLSGQ